MGWLPCRSPERQREGLPAFRASRVATSSSLRSGEGCFPAIQIGLPSRSPPVWTPRPPACRALRRGSLRPPRCSWRRLVEPEVVATSPNRIKSPVPVFCGFSSRKLSAAKGRKGHKTEPPAPPSALRAAVARRQKSKPASASGV